MDHDLGCLKDGSDPFPEDLSGLSIDV
jgi:hypothetical protein